MAVTARWYPTGIARFLVGNLEWDATDTFNMAVVADTYTYDADHQFYATSVQSHQASGSIPVALSNKTVTTVDWSALSLWQANTGYAVGDLVRASDLSGGEEHVFRCVVAGQSGASEPVWVTTTMRETEDNETVWAEFGEKVTYLDSDPIVFSGSFTGNQAVIYKTGVDGSSDYLVGHVEFGENKQIVDGTLTVTPATTGWLRAGSGGSPT